LQGVPTELTLLTNNLPSGYHREMQLTKEVLFPAINTIKDCLYITEYTLNHIQVKDNILEDEKYQYLFSVENVNDLVLNGVSFRDAYVQVGQSIENQNFEPHRNLNHTRRKHWKSLQRRNRKEFSKVFEKFN
jgi:argininosuccinate lyase